MATDLPDNSKHLPDDGLVPIRTVSSLTGVNPVTLRAWERRYNLIQPKRTAKGHRLYTMADVALISRVVALLESGMAIGQVQQVLSAQPAAPAAPEPPPPAADPWSDYQQRLIQATVNFDEYALDDIYNEALSLYPIDIVTTRLIVPLLHELGRRWETGEGNVAQEHFFSIFLRNKLGARFHHRSRDAQGPRLLTACLPDEQHEVGLLLFALSAVDRDYNVVLLGANMPLEELPAAQQQADCQAIVLSGCYQIAPAVLHDGLPQLLHNVTVPVFIGGRAALQCAQDLMTIGAIALGDDFNLALRKIAQVLSRHSAHPDG